jgi:hypothetical protein
MSKNLDLKKLTMYQIAWRDENGDWCFSPTMYSKESASGIAKVFREKDKTEAVVLEIIQTRTVVEEEQP